MCWLISWMVFLPERAVLLSREELSLDVRRVEDTDGGNLMLAEEEVGNRGGKPLLGSLAGEAAYTEDASFPISEIIE